MHTLLLAIVLTLIQTVPPTPTSKNSANDSGGNTQQSKEHKKEPTVPAPIQDAKRAESPKGNSENVTTKNEQEHVVVDRLPGKDTLDKVYIALTGVLVLIGAITLRAIWYQARETAPAARATEIAANAAKDSADALITENRPWLILAKETTLPDPSSWKSTVFVKNYGKTLGRIVSLRVEAQLGESANNPPDLSVYDGIETFHPFMLPPQEHINWLVRLPYPWSAMDLVTGKKHLWLCGFIRYSDTFVRPNTVPYETAFCLVYKLPQGMQKGAWQRPGNPEYNKAT